jgi:hypothetical protein
VTICRPAFASVIVTALAVGAASLFNTSGALAQNRPGQGFAPNQIPLPMPGQRQTGQLSLSATLSADGPPLHSGVSWRVFADQGEGNPPLLVQQSNDSSPVFTLEPGIYVIHAAYGLAGATKRITMGTFASAEKITLNAGGLRVYGAIGDVAIPDDRLKFSVFVPLNNDPEGRVVVDNARGGTLVKLPEGSYRVVSTYGDSNAIMSAEIKIEPGKVTDTTMRHKAATVTLKLVEAPGGEALANTTFSVLTPGGDTIREAIGAFPSMTLAEGDYVAIARNAGQVFTQEFRVRSGLDRDIEVLAKAKSD